MGGEAGPSGTRPQSKETQHPEPTLMKLLLTLLFDGATYFPDKTLVGCPVATADTVKKLINNIPCFTILQDVATALAASKS
jgi:hypothetical protein